MPPASDQHIAEIERRRAEAVRSLGILDTPDDVAFDELARLAADLAGTPMAAINFVEADRQWLKASIGFPRREFPRSFGFCPTVVDGGVALVVEDAAVEPRRPGAEAALGFGVRFYAGAPIRDAHGRTLGVVCVADGAPRRVDAERVERGLRAVAAQVLRLLELRRHVSLLQEATDARARAVEKLASYRSVLDGAVDACCLLDVDGRFVEQNAAHRRLLGYDDADLVDAFFAPVDAQVARAIREDLATEGAFRGETECLAKDGRKVPVDLAVFVVRDASGAPVRLAAMLRDLSRRREAESRLRESEERFRSAFERAPVGMTITALDGRLLRVNEAFRRFLGRSEEELRGRSFESITHPDFLPQNLDHVRRLLDGVVEAFSMEKLYLRGDGVPVWGEVTVAMIRDAEGAPLHLLAQVVDVDARKRAEARLSEARDRLEERVAERTAALEKAVAELRVEVAERKRVEEALRASEAQLVQSQKMEALGRLAGGVAHEFNNLLTVIVGHAELLTASGGTTDAEPILEAARRASAVTTRLLAFSRHQPAKPEVIDVDRVIRRQLEFLQPVLGERIDLRYERTGVAPPVRIDPVQLEQVVLNLVNNARDAMPRGGRLIIGLRGATRPVADGDAAERAWTEISVADEGTGMTPEIEARIFDPFFTTKEVGRGTGLGLSTVYGIVTQAGGTVSVRTAPGQGSEFVVALPCADGAPAEAPQPQAPRSGPAGDGRTVLVVEDDRQVNELVQTFLRRDGFVVIAAHSGAEALRLLERDPAAPAIVVTDVVMPGMTGPELVAVVRRLREDLPVLYMSGYHEERIRETLEPGAVLLAKPFTRAALTERVRALLDQRRAAATA